MIVITGAAGFIGSVLAWKMNHLGKKDLLLVDQKAKNAPKWENLRKRQFEIYLESDEFIGRLENKEFDGKISAIFHLGACSDTTEMDKAYLQRNNSGYTERLAQYHCHVLVEKPFAASVADARRMIAAMAKAGKLLAINWPLAWVPSHVMAKKLIGQGLIGDLTEVHFYDGNRGPLYHLADKVAVSPAEVEAQKPHSWWYRRASGGGSLRDYLGYGATLGSWYRGGAAPIEVTCTTDQTPGIEVDQHSITVCRYATGLSRMETRWGTFTDPWTIQPQPHCGFSFVGTEGTMISRDYASHVMVQTRARPEPHPIAAEPLAEGRRNAIDYVLGCIARGEPVRGPLDPEVSLLGQRIVDSAALSAQEKRTVGLLP